jgi:hypothetical protein
MTDFGVAGNVFFGGTPVVPVIPSTSYDLGDPQPVAQCDCPDKSFVTLTDGAIVHWDIASNYNAKITLQGNRQLVLDNIRNGDSGTLIVEQDAVGSRLLTLPANSLFIEGSLTLSTVSNAVDILAFLYDGINYHWVIGEAFA